MRLEIQSLLCAALLLGGCVAGSIENEPPGDEDARGGRSSKAGAPSTSGTSGVTGKGGNTQTGKGGSGQTSSGGSNGTGTGTDAGTGGEDSSGTGGSAGGASGKGGSAGKGGSTGKGGSSGTGGTGGGTAGTGGATSGECRMSGDVPVCCPATGANKTNVDEVFELLNAYRTSLGLSALAYDLKLEEAVQGHCKYMVQADFFAHDSPAPGLKTPWDRAKFCGTSANGENLAAGQRTPAEVMQGWKNSPGHDSNMRGNFKRVGVGEYEHRWGQLFGS